MEAAGDDDAAAIAALRNAAADRLTGDYGQGAWSGQVTEKGVRHDLKTARVLVARTSSGIAGTLVLQTKKPWAIDKSYFTDVPRAIYLLSMAVGPAWQRTGVGRRLLEAARSIVQAWPAQAIRLDAYDAPAGAAGFYARCGYQERGRVVYRRVPLVYFELLLEA